MGVQVSSLTPKALETLLEAGYREKIKSMNLEYLDLVRTAAFDPGAVRFFGIDEISLRSICELDRLSLQRIANRGVPLVVPRFGPSFWSQAKGVGGDELAVLISRELLRGDDK